MWNLYVEFAMAHPVAMIFIGSMITSTAFAIVRKVCDTVVEVAEIIRDISDDIAGIVDREKTKKAREPIGFKCTKSPD